MELTWSKTYRYRSGAPRPFYRCYRAPECKGAHGAHPDGTPLGQPGDAATRKLRSTLHDALLERLPRRTLGAHRRAAQEWLEVNGFGGHVGQMSAEECRTALVILGKYPAL